LKHTGVNSGIEEDREKKKRKKIATSAKPVILSPNALPQE
jgi:hypothetical protein